MTILTLEALSVHPTETANHQITMSLLANYYEKFLNPTYYDVELSDGNTIRIDFHKENFCHLIGIDQIAEAHFKDPKHPKMFMHKGKGGFKRAKNKNLEFSYLKNLHQHQYDYEERKFHFFHFIHTMMDSGNLKLVSYVSIPGSNLKCDFMFHDEFDNALLHLGVEKSTKGENFFPKTFFARYLSSAKADEYIAPQTTVVIKKINKVNRI